MPNVQRTKIIDAAAVASGASSTASWRNLGGQCEFRPRGFIVRFTSAGSATATVTLRYSMFRTDDPSFPAATVGNYTDVVLGTTLAKDTFYQFFPAALLHPIQSYTVVVAIATADATGVNVWEIAVPADNPALWMNDMGIGKTSVTIANAASESGAAYVPGTIVGIASPIMAASTVWLKASVSEDNVTFVDLYKAEGDLAVFSCNASAARTIYVDPIIFTAFRYVKFTALQTDKATLQAQDADKTITIYYRSV